MTDPKPTARAMSRVDFSAKVAALSCFSVFLSSKTSPWSVMSPTMACEDEKASSVLWIRYAVAMEQSIETTAVTPIATNRLCSALLSFGCFDLGFSFCTNVL